MGRTFLYEENRTDSPELGELMTFSILLFVVFCPSFSRSFRLSRFTLLPFSFSLVFFCALSFAYKKLLCHCKKDGLITVSDISKEVFFMNTYTTAYTMWNCKYHVVFVTKCRGKGGRADVQKQVRF